MWIRLRDIPTANISEAQKLTLINTIINETPLAEFLVGVLGAPAGVGFYWALGGRIKFDKEGNAIIEVKD